MTSFIDSGVHSIYTNSPGGGLIYNAFIDGMSEPCSVLLVAPFFSHDEIVQKFVEAKCEVRLIVRLGPLTSGKALERVMQIPGVKVRFFTSPRFHTKLYIFGQEAAIVGSANLTDGGLMRNRELAVVIPGADERFDALVELGQSYWSQAKPLEKEPVDEYLRMERAHPTLSASLENAVLMKWGDLAPEGIQVGKARPSRDKVWLEDYRRTYQEFRAAYDVVEQSYKASGVRHVPEDKLPLRIEIDQFLSYIREEHASGDGFQAAPMRTRPESEREIVRLIGDWQKFQPDYLINKAPVNYQHIGRVFESAKTIESATGDEIFEALNVCHAFYTRARHFPGGLATMKSRFLEDNPLEKLRKTLTFLLHGKGDFVVRMGSCIYDQDKKLVHFGKSGVQELMGWVNRENIPICNGRTIKALRFLGFNVKDFN